LYSICENLPPVKTEGSIDKPEKGYYNTEKGGIAMDLEKIYLEPGFRTVAVKQAGRAVVRKEES
jgi:hypothetical protein